MAASRGLTAADALHFVIEKTMQAHYNALECPRPHPGAYDSYISFFNRYFQFHTALRECKLEILFEG
jgi:hypothetical protein